MRSLTSPLGVSSVGGAGGASVNWLHNGTWSISGANLTNNPTLGSELLVNGNLETWTTATNAGTWAESVAGTSTVNQETSVTHGGSNAARLDVDGSNSSVLISQAVTTVVGTWYQMSVWSKANTGTPTMAMNGGPADVIKTLSTTYAQYFITARVTATSSTIILKRSTSSNSSLYFDDASYKALTLNQLFAFRTGNVNPGALSATGTIVAHTYAGVAYGWDSYTAPTTGILAIHDGGTGIHLLKCVAGTWTAVLSTSATYAAGILPRIVNSAANTYQLWYNNVQRGADQTISDAGTGTLHGVFSTYSGNAITGFSYS